MAVSKNAVKTFSGLLHSLRSTVRPGKRWSWPRAALFIFLVSLGLWGVVAAIALFAFN